MYRIDNPSAVVTLQAPGAPRTPGYFTDGNPAAGLEATIVDAWWLNQLQEEIISVIAEANITLNKTSHRQLLDALSVLFTGAGATGNFLPLTGGRLYRPGGSDILQIDADAGQTATMLFQVAGYHQWKIGPGGTGNFVIMDNTTGDFCIRIQQLSHDVEILGPNLTLAAPTLDQWIMRSNTTQNLNFGSTGGGRINNFYVNSTNVDFRPATTFTSNLRSEDTAWLNQIRATTVSGLSFVDASTFTGNVTANSITTQYLTGTQSIYSLGLIGANGPASFQSNVGINGLLTAAAGNISSLRVPVGLDVAGTGLHVEAGVSALFQGPVVMTDTLVVAGTNVPSDLRLKHHIRPYQRGLDAVCQLEPITYQYNGEGGIPADGRTHVGLVADVAGEIMPEMLGQMPDSKFKTLSPGPLTYALVIAVQELASRIEALEAKGA